MVSRVVSVIEAATETLGLEPKLLVEEDCRVVNGNV